MHDRKLSELSNEKESYKGTLFGAAPEASRLHLYVLGAPVLIEKSIHPKKLRWEAISAETIQYSFNRIPQHGFMVFPTYRDAHLYAHLFYDENGDPNHGNGIAGAGGCIEMRFCMGRFKLLYQPVVFEVACRHKSSSDIKWHPLKIGNMDGETKHITIGAIRKRNCKANLTVLSSRLAVEFIAGEKIKLAVLHDSKIQPQAEVSNELLERLEANSRRCLIM